MNLERLRQRLQQLRHGALAVSSQRNGDGKFIAVLKIDFACQRDVAVSSPRNSQSILKLSIKSCQPSLAPTYPMDRRENPWLHPMTRCTSLRAAWSRLCPPISEHQPELPAPWRARCGASSA